MQPVHIIYGAIDDYTYVRYVLALLKGADTFILSVAPVLLNKMLLKMRLKESSPAFKELMEQVILYVRKDSQSNKIIFISPQVVQTGPKRLAAAIFNALKQNNDIKGKNYHTERSRL